MKKIQSMIFSIVMLSISVSLQGAFLQQLIEAQEARGVRVTIPEDLQFKKQTENLTKQLAAGPQMSDVSQDNVERISAVLGSFYTLFFDPICIRFSTKDTMNDFFEQLKNWHEALKKKNVIIPWLSGSNGLELKNLLVQALKEICMFGRYTKHREENLVTFKLRLQYILTSIMMDSYLEPWKDQLINNNELMSLGSFYSWDVDLIKAEFKDSAALMPLFKKLSSTIDRDGEQQVAQRHQQELAAEKQLVAERKQKEAQILHNIVLNIQQQAPTDTAGRGILYLDCVRALLDPAYLDSSPTDRKAIDKIKDQFKNLHTIIGRTFMPIMPQEGIDALKLLIAKSIEIISSPAATGRAGGVAFKNHVEFVLKTLMTINPNQTLTENQIKFQWIKPLYLDNQFLIGDLKKKCLDKFNSSDFQRWQAGIRNFTFKVSSPVESTAPVFTPIISPVVPVQMPVAKAAPEKVIVPEEIVETLTLSKRLRPLPTLPKIVQPQPVTTSTTTNQVPETIVETIVETLPLQKTVRQRRMEVQEAERAAAAERAASTGRALADRKAAVERDAAVRRNAEANKKAAEADRRAAAERDAVAQRVAQEERKAAIVQKENSMPVVASSMPKAMQDRPAASSADLRQVSKNLIDQSLVAPASAVKNTLAKVEPSKKFDLMRMKDDTQYTAVHQAASLGRADVLKMLLEGLNQDQKFEVVKMRERDGQTALYLAAAAKSAPNKGFKPADAIKEMLDGLTLEQQIELINIPDNDGITPLEIAQSSNNKTIVGMIKEILQKGRR